MNTHYLAGLLSGLALTIAIGAQNAFVLRQGIRREHLLPIVLVCALSDALLITGGIAGLGVLLQSYPALMSTARYAGAVFLLAYATHAASRAWVGQHMAEEESEDSTLQIALLSCLGFTFLNPHVYLDTVVLLGALGNQHGTEGRWVFGAGAVTGSVVWFLSLAYGARMLAPLFRKAAAWRLLDILIATTMALLAIGLIIADEGML